MSIVAKKAELRKEITELEEQYNAGDTPQNIKDLLKGPLENARKMLTDLEKTQVQEKKETVTPAVVKKEEKKATNVVKAAKEIVKKVKASKKQKNGSTAHKHTLKAIVAKSKTLSAMYKGVPEKDLQADAKHKAKQPGSRISATGNTYREYRGNRSDISQKAPYLEAGGTIKSGKLNNNDVKEINSWLKRISVTDKGSYYVDKDAQQIIVYTASANTQVLSAFTYNNYLRSAYEIEPDKGISFPQKIKIKKKGSSFAKGGVLSGPAFIQEKLGIKFTTEFGDTYRDWINKFSKSYGEKAKNGKYVGYQIDSRNNHIRLIFEKGVMTFEVTGNIRNSEDAEKYLQPIVDSAVYYAAGGTVQSFGTSNNWFDVLADISENKSFGADKKYFEEIYQVTKRRGSTNDLENFRTKVKDSIAKLKSEKNKDILRGILTDISAIKTGKTDYKHKTAGSSYNVNATSGLFDIYSQAYRYGEFEKGGAVNNSFDYMMLSRLQSDCEYYLNYGNRSERVLPSGNVDEHIKHMKTIWNKLNVKPEWLSMEDIEEYEKKMKNQFAKGGPVENNLRAGVQEFSDELDSLRVDFMSWPEGDDEDNEDFDDDGDNDSIIDMARTELEEILEAKTISVTKVKQVLKDLKAASFSDEVSPQAIKNLNDEIAQLEKVLAGGKAIVYDRRSAHVRKTEGEKMAKGGKTGSGKTAKAFYNAAIKYLKEVYLLNPEDTSIDRDSAQQAFDNGIDPFEFIDDYAEKYDLDKYDEYPFEKTAAARQLYEMGMYADGGEINNDIWLSVDGAEPITYEEFHKANTDTRGDMLSPDEFEAIKNLKIGEIWNETMGADVKRVSNPDDKFAKGGQITYEDGRPVPYDVYGSNGEYYIKDTNSQRTLPSSTVSHYTGKMNQFSSKKEAKQALITILTKWNIEQPGYNPKIKFSDGGQALPNFNVEVDDQVYPVDGFLLKYSDELSRKDEREILALLENQTLTITSLGNVKVTRLPKDIYPDFPLIIDEGTDDEVHTTLDEFLKTNDHGEQDDDIDSVKMLAPGESVHIGGGAAARFKITRPDTMEKGGATSSYLGDDPVWHVAGLNRPPKNFTPAAAAEFKKAILSLEKEKPENGEESGYYKSASAAMATLVNLVSELLGTDGTETAASTHKLLQEVGIYNYKTGLLVDTDFLNKELANRKLKLGGRLKSALMRDRAYKSQEPHEQAYHRQTSPKHPHYKYEEGGAVNEYVADEFTTDDEKYYPGFHIPAERWNGWATPVFEKETALKILKEYGYPYKEVGENIEFDTSGYEGQPEEEKEIEVFKPHIITINGKEKTVYGIGSYYWVWDEKHDDEDEFAHGGSVENQYAGKTAEQVWNDWTVDQRKHFLSDHNKQLSPDNRYKDIEKMADWDYSRVGTGIRPWVEQHIKEGQYAKGGEIKKDKVEKLAKEFCRILRRDLDKKQMKAIITGDKHPDDYLDANMTMDEAFLNITGRRFIFFNDEFPETERQNAEDTNLMNNAWGKAIANTYYDGKELSYPRKKENIVVVAALDDKNDKSFTELGEAVHYAENESMKVKDTFAVKVAGKNFGFAKDGGWEDDNQQLLAKGGRTTAAISRDRKFKSKEPHEQAYKRKTSPKNPVYKKQTRASAKKIVKKYAKK